MSQARPLTITKIVKHHDKSPVVRACVLNCCYRAACYSPVLLALDSSIRDQTTDMAQMEVRMKKIPTKAGQYVFINCPEVSQIEWHPFT
jgi:hypothetical protein